MWEDIRAEVEQLTDALGKPVDEGIIESVTGLRALGFPTSASCEGHFEHGCPYPWIDVEVPDSSERPKTIEDKEDLERKRLQLEHRLLDLLEDFYSNRQVPYHRMLIIQPHAVNWFRLRSAGGEVSAILGWGRCHDRLKLYIKEMTAFSSFLKERYHHAR
jgi:hypothetical protein